MGSFYVTTPIYYVNAAPHMGHAYTTIAADVMARHHRQRGDDVFFLTGVDEHGEPVANAAEAQGMTPQALADLNSERFRSLMPRLNASNDFFIRTTDPEHKAKVQEVLTRIKDNGFVYEGHYEGWYCPRCADFKSETEIEDGNRCPVHHIELTREQEENYFFRLSAFQERLEALYADNPDFVGPRHRANEALAFIKGGLQDVSLSRAKLSWGVTVPWDESHVFYVWFDALLNYYTALSYARPGEDLTERFWPPQLHVIGKDILKFHAVFWPALLMAAGLPVPERIYIHGYLLMDGEKMSKSLGNVLDPLVVIDRFGTDALRHYVLRDVTFGQDGSVSTEAFEQRYESELANGLGNLASRSLAMVRKYRDGAVPAVEPELREDFDGLADEVAALIDRAELTPALELVWERVRRLNRYVEETAPWTLAKDPADAERLDVVLATLVEGVRVVAVLLASFLPETAEKLLAALGAPDTAYAGATLTAGTVTQVQALSPLFPKDIPVAAA
ncbi:MAG: methionyl-tRNA synthetase [Solirubrobacterales bacterium]|jgi:methionyl-tRNA synthetase|nr:methionyl-tRNA synthetase [Solirubrobacterales bacterium]